MKYEVFIAPGYGSATVDAGSAEEARRQFSDMLRDNMAPEHIVANNLDTDDGRDPK